MPAAAWSQLQQLPQTTPMQQPRLLQHQQQAQLAASRPARSHHLSCFARRTVSGGGGGGGRDPRNKTSTLGRPGKSGNTNSSSSSASSKEQLTVKRTPAPQPSRTGTQKKQQRSRLEDFMRSTPGLNRFLDGTLILGDAVMILATEFSSERLPFEQLPALAGVAVGSWILAGAMLGDYTAEPDPDANPLSDALGWPIFAAVVNSMVTWAVSLVVSLFGFSWLVSHYIIEPEMIMEVAHDNALSPQLEVSVAMLITMSCWRGMAARLRL